MSKTKETEKEVRRVSDFFDVRDGQKFTRWVWGFYLVVFLFPRRFLLMSLDNNAYGQVISFLNWFFYFSEFLLPVALLGVLVFFQEAPLKNVPRRLWAFLAAMSVCLVVGLVVHRGVNFDLLMLVRMAELWAVSYLVTRQVIAPQRMFALVLAGVVVQAGMGIGQFGWQESVGLSVLGEPQLSVDTLGIAKIDLGSEKYIRPVGTLVHANAWGSAMLMGILILPIWYRKMMESSRRVNLQKARKAIEKTVWGQGVIYGIGFLLTVASFLSFSRSVWLGLGLLVLLAAWHHRKRMWTLGFLALAGLGGVVWQWPLIAQRIADWQVAFGSRMELWDYTMRVIRENPWGIGVGKFVSSLAGGMSMRMFAPWEMQPVHSVFLLVGAQLGWLAMTAVLIYVLAMVIRARKNAFGFVGFLAVVLVGLVDHFFWTDYAMGVLVVIFLTVWEVYVLANKKAGD